jgi:hypothetical protein
MIKLQIDKENDFVKVIDDEDRFVILKYSESIMLVEKTIKNIIKDIL